MERGLLTSFQPSPGELVVHSPEWSTGSHLFRAFDPVSASSQGASGPLSRVVHWLATFRAFDPVSAFSLGASGPLSKVDHWLSAFRAFDPVSAPSQGASGPLDGVDHWLTHFPSFRPSLAPRHTKARARPGRSQFLKLLERSWRWARRYS